MKFLKNKKGQITVEYLLLAVALIALFQIATGALRRSESLKNFHEIPGLIFGNLVENGDLWPDVRRSRLNHPNHYERHYTPNGDGPK